jgi:type I site-specific restriction endonuclease
MNEASARIKINKLLESAGWRFFANANCPANVQLEPNVTLKAQELDALGENFERASKGYIDFLLLNEKSFPFIVLEAKSEDKHPLVGKEQARKYAKSQNCRFVIVSNGNLHYFWDLERGNPYIITSFPTPTSVEGYEKSVPEPTGYDCPDILKLGLFRPVFSPTDFIQIKGRGTRKHEFRELFDEAIKENVASPNKAAYKLFDFLVPAYVKDYVSLNRFAA